MDKQFSMCADQIAMIWPCIDSDPWQKKFADHAYATSRMVA